MNDGSEIDFIINGFIRWTADARRDHADLLETANDLFGAHGFEPFSRVIVNAVSEFEAELASRAQHRVNLDPEDETPEVANLVSSWSRKAISQGGHDMMVLAAIYSMGAEKLESALESCTPEAPSY